MVEFEWMKTFELRRDMNLYMGEFVVMPDHFHAILGIGNNPYNSLGKTGHDFGESGDLSSRDTSECANRFGFQSKNLASIMRGFKSAVTMNARKINPDFEWQPRFHEKIIRNSKAHDNITQYILLNPYRVKI
jgi:REP element-mobilizing transposase RayT